MAKTKDVLADYLTPEVCTLCFWRHAQPKVVSLAREALIVARLKILNLGIAAFLLFWLPIDYLLLPLDIFTPLMVMRLIAVLALMCSNIYLGYRGLTYQKLLVTVLLTFIAFISFSMWAAVVLHSCLNCHGFLVQLYTDLPFAILLSVAFFPFTVPEFIILAGFIGLGALFVFVALANPSTWGVVIAKILVFKILALMAAFFSIGQLWLILKKEGTAQKDGLTGAVQREEGITFLERILSLSKRNRLPLSLLLVGIDDLRQLNEYFGHKAGDEALQITGETLRQILRAEDVVVRWGGGEFLVLLPNTPTENGVTHIFDRLREKGFGERPDSRPLTVSVGVAAYQEGKMPSGQTSVNSLIMQAEKNLQMAKNAGKNTIVWPDGSAESFVS